MNLRILSLIFAGIVSLSAAQSGDPFDPVLNDEYQYCFRPVQDYAVYWTFNNASNMLNVTIKAEVSATWLAFGFKNGTLGTPMTQADVVIGYVLPNGTAVINDYYIPTDEAFGCGGGVCPDADQGGVDNILNKTGKQVVENGKTFTYISYNRLLYTADQHTDIDLRGTIAQVNWAIGGGLVPSDSTQHIDKGGVRTNLTPLSANYTCPNSCSGHGNCSKGCCRCDAGWTRRDCSLQSNASTTCSLDTSKYKFSEDLQAGFFELHWTLSDDKESISIAYKAKLETGWVGFGVSRSGGMVDSDVFLVSTLGPNEGGEYFISARSQSGVNRDRLQDASGFKSCTTSDGYLVAEYTRLLDTGDTEDDLVWSAGNNDIVWAANTRSATIDPHPNQHDSNKKGTKVINFSTGVVSDSNKTDLRVVHGALMFIAWAVLAPIASFVGRHLKKFKWWWPFHYIVQSLVLITMSIAFVIIVYYVAHQNAPHFDNNHAKIGLTIVIVALVCQPLLGILANKMYKSDRTSTPVFPDMIHGFIGWTVTGLAVANVAIGMHQYSGKITTLNAIYIAYACILTAFIVVYSGYKLFRGLYGRKLGYNSL